MQSNIITVFAAYKVEKVYHNDVQLDENFEDDNVIVVLNSKVSEINKIYSSKLFEGIEIDSITDLTKRKFNLINKKKDFHQILQIH